MTMIRDLLAVAGQYDDKPHLLYSRVARMADSFCDDADQRTKIVRLMSARAEVRDVSRTARDIMRSLGATEEEMGEAEYAAYLSDRDS